MKTWCANETSHIYTSILDLESSIMFELSATDTQALTIEFEVPAGMSSSGSTGGIHEESMMSVQLDLASNAEVKTTLFCTGDKDYIPETFLDKVIQR